MPLAFSIRSRLLSSRALPLRTLPQQSIRFTETPRYHSSPAVSKEHAEEAKRWLATFRTRPLERSDVELSFARSSGPGGQNVNKLNTKAVVRYPLNGSLIPHWAKDVLRTTNAYVAASDSLQVSSTISRSQATNVDDCLKKLHTLILTQASTLIRAEPSVQQTKHVQDLALAADARRKVSKVKRKDVKSGRGRVFGGGE